MYLASLADPTVISLRILLKQLTRACGMAALTLPEQWSLTPDLLARWSLDGSSDLEITLRCPELRAPRARSAMRGRVRQVPLGHALSK